MTRLLTVTDFDLATCEHPGCIAIGCIDRLIIHSTCHQDEPVWVRYDGDGIITIMCSFCGSDVCQVAVASGC